MEQHRIGRYQVVEEIAAGSQGAVYSAFDPDSGQIVAVKVLHPSLTGNRDYLERFRREASLASSIDHPNVVKIFEVGQDGDRHFIALEFLPESLSRVIEGAGALPVERAAAFAIQIARGLAAAHALGIVHRDVKPQNVLIGPDGTAKLTDFGIARGELLPTMTATGATMGTPYYMSPEQARGERADERSDLYSLGCVLYQMLAGEVPFKGDTPLAVVRQHIEERARPVRRLRSDVPTAVERIVSRSMEKRPERRYQTARELVEALTEAVHGAAPVERDPSRQALRTPPPAPHERPVSAPVRPSRLLGFFRRTSGGILVLWGLSLLLVGLNNVSEEPVLAVLFIAGGTVTLGAGVVALRRRPLALGPLGRGRLVGLLAVAGLVLFMAGGGQSDDGQARSNLDVVDSTPVSGAVVASIPTQTATTAPVPAPTATSVPVAPTATSFPAVRTAPETSSWIVYTGRVEGTTHIFKIRPDGSGPTQITTGESHDLYPTWSPDKSRIAFMRQTTPEGEDRYGDIYVNSDGTGLRRLTRGGDYHSPDWFPSGDTIIVDGFGSGLQTVGLTGGDVRVVLNDSIADRPDWSPDGSQVAFHRPGDPGELFVMNADGSDIRSLGKGFNSDWSPDGSRILFHYEVDGDWDVLVINADGTGFANLTAGRLGDDILPDWSPDGEQIVFAFREGDSANWELGIMNAEGGPVTNITNNPGDEFLPQW